MGKKRVTKRGKIKLPRTIIVGKLRFVRQTAKGKKSDRDRKAMPPGKRISFNGHTYYEYRSNRAD